MFVRLQKGNWVLLLRDDSDRLFVGLSVTYWWLLHHQPFLNLRTIAAGAVTAAADALHVDV